MSGWHYTTEDERIGPVNDEELLRLAFDGKLTAETPVFHPTHTKGEWVTLDQIPSARQRLDSGIAHRKQQEAAHREERKQEAAHREERKQQKATHRKQAQDHKEATIQEAANRRSHLPRKSYPALRILSTIYLVSALVDLGLLAMCWACWLLVALVGIGASDDAAGLAAFSSFLSLFPMMFLTIVLLTHALLAWSVSQLLTLVIDNADNLRASRNLLAQIVAK